VENYNGALIRALQDVSDQLVMLQSNSKQLAEAETALKFASKAFTLAQTGYRVGLSNYQHVLDAKILVIRQQETIAQMQAVRLDSYAGLMRALGGGMVEEAAKNTNQTKLELP
jgi:outer membrane protein TolC